MKNLLFNTYELQTSSGIWQRPDFSGIPYNDGDEVESRIFKAINEATDFGLHSKELAAQCIDWPSHYHLSPVRSNLLRPFEEKLKGKKVLEIGSGCGAITRYLSDLDCNLVALEGSTRRSMITRARTRDSNNVQVVCDSFTEFQCDESFDFVTLIGVLEYAPKFVGGANPALAMLKRALQLLSPTGSLLIAIENKLGLKYFAGASEDHLGVPMYGLEGLYKSDEPETFGRRELERIIQRAGFNHCHFYLPFPDYKFPRSVISPAGQNCSQFDAAALISSSSHKDVQLPKVKTMSIEMAWHTVCSNELISDLSNSFLIEATNVSINGNADIFAWHYSLERREAYRKATLFRYSDQTGISIATQQLCPTSTDHDTSLRLRLSESPYIIGQSLQRNLVTVLAYDGWRLNQMGNILQPYLQYLLEYVTSPPETEQDRLIALVPGSFIDCIPQNIMVSNDGVLTPFDQEWELETPVSIERVLFRSALALAGSISRVSRCADMRVNTPHDLFLAVLRCLELPETTSDILRLMQDEVNFHQMVTGQILCLSDFNAWYTSYCFPQDNLQKAYSINLQELKASLESSSTAQDLAERKIRSLTEHINELTDINNNCIQRIDALSDQVKATQSQLVEIQQSTSWKITSPMRWLTSAFRH